MTQQVTPGVTPDEPDIAELERDEQAAHTALQVLKNRCFGLCSDAEDAVLALDDDARQRAVVAHHILRAQEAEQDPVHVLAARGNRLTDSGHAASVAEAWMQVLKGADVHDAAGSDPAHVQLLEAAAAAHEEHRAELEAAYKRVATASRALVEARGQVRGADGRVDDGTVATLVPR